MNLTTFIPSFLPGESPAHQWPLFEATYHNWTTQMQATPQDPGFHSEGDVWTHTKMVMDALIAHPWWHALDEQGRRITWLAALLHDMGKPATTIEDPLLGRITSAGHSARGASDARIWLYKQGLPFVEREMVCSLVERHQHPFYTIKKEDYAQKIRQWSYDVRLDWLATVTIADALGRTTSPTHLRQEAIDNVELFRIACEEQNLWGRCAPYADAYTWQKYCNAPAQVDPTYALRGNTFPVWVLSGLPGMGKDTWANTHLPSLPMVSLDNERTARGVGHGKDTGEIVHAVFEKAKVHLRRQQPFIWNATHLNETMRKKVLDVLWNYHAEVHLVYVECSSYKEWRAQNHSRLASVPDVALDQLMFRWKPPLLSEAEHIHYVINKKDVSPEMRSLCQHNDNERKIVHIAPD